MVITTVYIVELSTVLLNRYLVYNKVSHLTWNVRIQLNVFVTC